MVHVGTYSTKPWAAERILLRSGKVLRPVLQMVLRRKDLPLEGDGEPAAELEHPPASVKSWSIRQLQCGTGTSARFSERR